MYMDFVIHNHYISITEHHIAWYEIDNWDTVHLLSIHNMDDDNLRVNKIWSRDNIKLALIQSGNTCLCSTYSPVSEK